MLTFLAAAMAMAPVGQPIYLNCTLNQTTGPLAVEVALDEATQVATISMPNTGWTISRTALWGPDKITVPDKEQTFILDRVASELSRTFSFSASVERGPCSLKAVPAKRAF